MGKTFEYLCFKEGKVIRSRKKRKCWSCEQLFYNQPLYRGRDNEFRCKRCHKVMLELWQDGEI